ncbi:MAG: hypothetical protein ACTSXO_11120 [Candidatus Heimdallarchaeota archaeon]
MSKKPDLRSISSVTLEGDGDFDEVHILGGLQSSGSLNANYVSVQGSMNLLGSLWATNVNVAGGVELGADLISELDIVIKGGIKTGGKLEGRIIDISGGARVKEMIKASQLQVKGGVKVNGNIEVNGPIDVKGGLVSLRSIIAEEIDSVGGISANGDVKARDSIYVRGRVEVGGDITCDEFIFEIGGPSVIEGKLQANKIKIMKDELAKSESFLRVKEIVSPNKIEIDYVIAESVVCPKMKTGENCRIGEPIDKNYEPDY